MNMTNGWQMGDKLKKSVRDFMIIFVNNTYKVQETKIFFQLSMQNDALLPTSLENLKG